MAEQFKTNDYNIETLICPACHHEEANVITHVLDIPYYDDFAMVNISCPKCGYRTSDFMNLRIKDHTIFTYKISGEKDGSTKVVRASQGTVTIPELGISIEPNGDGTTWIRNIEGILEDIKQKLLVSLRYAENNEEKRTVKQRIKSLKRLLNFEVEFTIIVDDPSGNSLILPIDESKLQKEIIQSDEAETDNTN